MRIPVPRIWFFSHLTFPIPKRITNSLLYFLALIGLVFVLALLVPRLVVFAYAQPRLYTIEQVPSKRVAVVFGAGLLPNGNLSPELSDRVTTAANLYFSGKVDKLLMSGDNRIVEHNEPGAMRKYAMRLGVPNEAIVQDFAGRRTYDTCYRASRIFGLNDVILITQEYHLLRALYTCNMLGVNAIGVPADRSGSPYLYGNLREIPATVVALWQIYFSHPVPVLGNPEPIFPVNASY